MVTCHSLNKEEDLDQQNFKCYKKKMSSSVDWIISITIILALILTIWAKISHQTIGELIADIKERFTDKVEDTTEAMTIYE